MEMRDCLEHVMSRVWVCQPRDRDMRRTSRSLQVMLVMVHFRVFLGAPSPADLDTDPNGYVWQTFQESSSIAQHSQSLLVLYPPATLDAASHRISLLYQNVIFDSFSDSQEPEPDHVLGSQQDADCGDRPGMSSPVYEDPRPEP